jgi:hypothetical protein
MPSGSVVRVCRRRAAAGGRWRYVRVGRWSSGCAVGALGKRGPRPFYTPVRRVCTTCARTRADHASAAGPLWPSVGVPGRWRAAARAFGGWSRVAVGVVLVWVRGPVWTGFPPRASMAALPRVCAAAPTRAVSATFPLARAGSHVLGWRMCIRVAGATPGSLPRSAWRR